MHENVARQLRDFLQEPIALEWGGESTALSPLPLIFSYKSKKSLCGAGHGDGLPILTMDPMRYQLKLDDVRSGETTNDG